MNVTRLIRFQTLGSKRFEIVYGNDTEAYEAIRMRVLQERAVVNAIEALQERWRIIMYMYHDFVFFL